MNTVPRTPPAAAGGVRLRRLLDCGGFPVHHVHLSSVTFSHSRAQSPKKLDAGKGHGSSPPVDAPDVEVPGQPVAGKKRARPRRRLQTLISTPPHVNSSARCKPSICSWSMQSYLGKITSTLCPFSMIARESAVTTSPIPLQPSRWAPSPPRC